MSAPRPVRTLTSEQASAILPWMLHHDPEPEGLARALTDAWLNSTGVKTFKHVTVTVTAPPFAGSASVKVEAPSEVWRYALTQSDYAGLWPTD